MLLGFGGRNCWSFKEWLTIDLTLNKKVGEQYTIKDTNVTPVLFFMGPNASGKSTALRVLTFIAFFCRSSFELKPDGIIPFESYFNNGDDSEFYMEFFIEGKRYLYELILNNRLVKSEKLTLKGDKKEALVSRKLNKFKINKLFNTNSNIQLRDNVSFFSTAFQYGLKETKAFYDFFSSFSSNIFKKGTFFYSTNDEVAEFYYNNPKIKKRVVKELKRFDTGIKDVEILKLYGNNNEVIYLSQFHHFGSDNALSVQSQSMGTRTLYNMLGQVFAKLETGGVLILDEIDDHIHPDITPHIINYFADEKNTKTQLLFTSHNSAILDITKKYRSYIFAKVDGESLCYRIDELPKNIEIRNDRSLSATYHNGILGGHPNVKA